MVDELIGEIPQRFKGTPEEFWRLAYQLSTYKHPGDLQFRMTASTGPNEYEARIEIGANGWALAQRLPGGGCSVTVGLESDGLALWQVLYDHLAKRGFWASDTAQTVGEPSTLNINHTSVIQPGRYPIDCRNGASGD